MRAGGGKLRGETFQGPQARGAPAVGKLARERRCWGKLPGRRAIRDADFTANHITIVIIGTPGGITRAVNACPGGMAAANPP